MDHIPPSASGSRRNDPRVERSRSALRAALLGLLEERSFDQITIRDISGRAGTGYATFFRHYPDKAALLNDLAAAEVGELLKRALPILYAVDTRASCVSLCTYVDEHRQLWAALLTGGAAGTLREEFVRQSRVAAVEAPPGVRPGSWLPTDLAVVFGVSAVAEILAWWLRHPRDFTIEGIADILDRLVIAPILQPA